MPALKSAILLAANTDESIVSGTVYELFAAKQREFLYKIIIKSLGDNAATVARLYINNGWPVEEPTNNSFIADITLTVATASQTEKQPDYEIVVGLWIPERVRVLMTLGTAGTDGYMATAVRGEEYAERFLVSA